MAAGRVAECEDAPARSNMLALCETLMFHSCAAFGEMPGIRPVPVRQNATEALKSKTNGIRRQGRSRLSRPHAD